MTTDRTARPGFDASRRRLLTSGGLAVAAVVLGGCTTRAVSSLVADNPGVWMLQCHNGYDSESGMMTRLEYTA